MCLALMIMPATLRDVPMRVLRLDADQIERVEADATLSRRTRSRPNRR